MMNDYISREAAADVLRRLANALDEQIGYPSLMADVCQGVILDAATEISLLPAANVEPVQHGRWEGYTYSRYYGCDEDGDPIFRDGVVYFCSNLKCRRKTVIKEKYCPDCGNIMDLEGEDG